MDNKRRVLVGMSGGIDSSAACLMLQEQGYEIVGVTLRTWDTSAGFSVYGAEEPDHIVEARRLAETLGFRHLVADVREAFHEQIVGHFVSEYLSGRTPNPCVQCNPLFKFRILCEYADRYGCDWIATGHYSLIEREGETCYVAAGRDAGKDQSYFLWRLGQEVLSRTLFPLGGYTKREVREYLEKKGFEAKAREGESMEICFVEGDYRDFLRREVPDLDHRIGRGAFVNAGGVKLGDHQGFPYYTVGQRKGLQIALGHPVYVLRINAEKNTVILGEEHELHTCFMLVEGLQWTGAPVLSCAVRIRYHATPEPCTLSPLEEGRWLVNIPGGVSAVTPGQSAVFYQGNRVVGGAYIASQRGLGMYIKSFKRDEK